MLNRASIVSALVLGLAPSLSAEVVQLKDKATISGTILAEKRDQVFIDVGYTVLSIPRSAVLSISREAEPTPLQPSAKGRKGKAGATNAPAQTVAARTPSASGSGMYRSEAVPPPERSVRELVSQLGGAVVQVRTPAGLGSGFIINEEGYLITNFHVVEGETQISVEVYDQASGQLERKSYKQVRIVAMNKFQDLALLKIADADAPKFPSVALGDTDNLAVGERVFAIGSPLGLERTVTEGIVSTKTRQLMGELYMQTTAQINPGNSGGPLFNMRGEVMGVTNMKLAFGEGLGFAIPVDAVKFFLNHRDAYAYDSDNPSNAYRYLEPPSRVQQLGVTRNRSNAANAPSPQ